MSAKKEGPFGASQGTPFDIDYSQHPPKSLVAIYLWTRNGQISAIKYTYEDEGGQQITKGPLGRTAGAEPAPPINISSSEAVKKVFGSYTQEHITSFGVDTTETEYPAKGNSGPCAFNTVNENIVAFFGRYNASGVNAIGTYYLP